MSFDWSEYLNLAKTLFNQGSLFGSEEAALRAAISRAYYAAFCEARNFLERRGRLKRVKTGDDHSRVMDAFSDSSDSEWNQIGIWLDRLRSNRNKADYEDDFPNYREHAQKEILRAERVIEQLKLLK